MQLLAGRVTVRRGRPGLLRLVLLSSSRSRPQVSLPWRPKAPNEAPLPNTSCTQPLGPIRVPHRLRHSLAHPTHAQEHFLPLPIARTPCSSPTPATPSAEGPSSWSGRSKRYQAMVKDVRASPCYPAAQVLASLSYARAGASERRRQVRSARLKAPPPSPAP